MTNRINNTQNEGKGTKGFSDKAKKGLTILAVAGIGCGYYGFKIGQAFGYRRGFRNGEVFANDQFRDVAKYMVEVIRKSEGE